MTVRQVTKILGDIPVRRVEGGDGWITRANTDIGEEKFKRYMTGDDIASTYNTLTLEQRISADTAFALNDVEVNELVDEVFRIREEQSEEKKENRNDSMLQVFGFILALMLLALGGIAVSLVVVTTLRNQEVPTGYILATFQMLIRYLTHQELDVP